MMPELESLGVADSKYVKDHFIFSIFLIRMTISSAASRQIQPFALPGPPMKFQESRVWGSHSMKTMKNQENQ